MNIQDSKEWIRFQVKQVIKSSLILIAIIIICYFFNWANHKSNEPSYIISYRLTGYIVVIIIYGSKVISEVEELIRIIKSHKKIIRKHKQNLYKNVDDN